MIRKSKTNRNGYTGIRPGRPVLLLLLMLLMGAFVLTGCGGSGTGSAASDSSGSGSAAEAGSEADGSGSAGSEAAGSDADGSDAAGIGVHHVEIEIAEYGTVSLELDGDTAPITVRNFLDLAGSGFYDGLTFHRIIDGFMIQGGDPNGDGTGGSETTIRGEFSSNGVDNDISHEKGVISMARSQDPDSASSQFFICVADSDFLDGEYAAFGHVTEGQEIVDRIASDAEPQDDNGTIAREDQPVITTIRVVD